MLKSYVTIALRHLRRQAGYSLINVTGLAVGMAVCMLILLFVRHELSYDHFHEKANRTYRVLFEIDWGERNYLHTRTPAALGSQLHATFPEIEHAVRASSSGQDLLVTAATKAFYENACFLPIPIFSMYSTSNQ